MFITNIKESGTSSTLRWAIQNGADVKQDTALCSIINDELFYIVTIEDVSFFERFRLIQHYRNSLRTLNTKYVNTSDEELEAWFSIDNKAENGDWNPAADENIPKKFARIAIDAFTDLALQMKADDDIIDGASRDMFQPMINCRYTVQIPVPFITIINGISVEDAKYIFNSSYPDTLDTLPKSDGARHAIQLDYMRATSPIKYSSKYEAYINATKYVPVGKPIPNSPDTHRVGLLSFYKFDPASRGEVRCNLIPPPEEEELTSTLKSLKSIRSPLIAEFSVQAPIAVLSDLLNTFSWKELPNKYDSSITNIISNGIPFNNFVEPSLSLSLDDPADKAQIRAHENNINNYRIRIAEALNTSLTALAEVIKASKDTTTYFVDETMAYSVLPSVFHARTVITLDMSKRDDLVNGRSHRFLNETSVGNIIRDAWTLMDRINENINSVT